MIIKSTAFNSSARKRARGRQPQHRPPSTPRGRSCDFFHKLGQGAVRPRGGLGWDPLKSRRPPHRRRWPPPGEGSVSAQFYDLCLHPGRARAQPHEHLSVLEHLDSPAAHRCLLHKQKPVRVPDGPVGASRGARLRFGQPVRQQGAGSGRYVPTTPWPVDADSELAGICRSRRGRYMPTAPPPPPRRGGRITPTLKWPDYADC